MRGQIPQVREQFLNLIEQAITKNPVTQEEVLRTHAW